MQEIATLVNFAVVMLVLWHFGRKPVREFLSKRSVDVAAAMEEAGTLSRRAGQELSEWEARWKASGSEVEKQLEETKLMLAKQRELAADLAKKEAARIRQEAILVGGSERARSEQNLRTEVIRKSIEMARRYLGSHLEDKDRHKLVADYLEIVSHGEAR